ncbi:DUF5908 family protein [Niastella populi]|uniref:DUF5908 family protein n=1 Tax=Niastella populi TaxID=550983 RepID=UPI0013FD7B70|nr:DUF5908 family protein [Niastella populi]
MPLEIRELVIKVEIDEATQKHDGDDRQRYEELKKEIMKECMKKIESKLENLFTR